jgi:arsenate reductase
MQVATGKIKVLFLCTGNSCRSQMAEGWTRRLKGAVIEPYSAGVETHGLNARAVKVMAEAGIDISEHRSKRLDELRSIPFDYVVTSVSRIRPDWPRTPIQKKRPCSITAVCEMRFALLWKNCPAHYHKRSCHKQ